MSSDPKSANHLQDRLYTQSTALAATAIEIKKGLLWLALLRLPIEIPAPELESSWSGALSYFAARGLQWGTEVIFTFGPLGYLYSHFYSGYLIQSKIIIEILLKFVFALLLLFTARPLTRPMRALFLLTVVLFAPLSPDPVFVFVIILILANLVHRESERFIQWCGTFFLALFSLIKFSFLLLAFAGFITIGLYWLWQNKWTRLSETFGAFALSFMILWTMTGQSASGIVPYLQSGLEVSNGYTQAMFSSGLPEDLVLGVVALTLTAMLIASTFICAKTPISFVTLLLFCEGLFISWKHGFVRADIHILSLFCFTAFASTAVWALMATRRPNKPALLLTFTCVGLSYAGAQHGLPEDRQYLAFFSVAKIGQNISLLSGLSRHIRSLEQQLAKAKDRHQLPRVKSIIGDRSVDVFGHEQGIAILNELNYRPRPILQGYSAYNRFLVNANGDYYWSRNAPEFVIFKLQSINHRFAPADDSAALEALFYNYTAIAAERGYLLWRKRSEPVERRPRRRLVQEGTANFREKIALPGDQRLLWLEIHWNKSWLASLREFIYKPAEVTLQVVTQSGAIQQYRLVEPLAKVGFLITPLLTNATDASNMLRGSAELRSRAFQLTSSAGFFHDYRYRVWAAADPPANPLLRDEVRNLNFWMFSDTPRQAKLASARDTMLKDGPDVFSAPAPSEIIFDVSAGASTVAGEFGIDPRAYESAEGSDGVEFIVEFADRRQQVRLLYRRLLQPFKETKDRGMQRFSISVPAGIAGEVRLRTTVDPFNTGKRYWSYWTNVKFN